MKLTYAKINNFLSFDSKGIQLPFSDINVFTGPNSSGKTNLLRTLWYVGSTLSAAYFGGTSKKYEDSTHQRAGEEIEVGLSLADDEVVALANYLVLSPLAETLRVSDGQNQSAYQQLAFLASSHLPRARLQNIFRNVSVIVKAGGFPRRASQILLKVELNGNYFYINRNGFSSFPVSNPVGPSTQFAMLLVACAISIDSGIEEALKAPAYDENGALKLSLSIESSELFERLFAEITSKRFSSISLPSAFSLDNVETRPGASTFVNGLREFVRGQEPSNQAFDFLSIVSTMYNNALAGTSDLRVRPEDYVPLPQNLELEARNLKQVDGKKLSVSLFYLKNSPYSKDRERYSQICESLRDLSGTEVDVVLHRRSGESVQSPEEVPLLVTVPSRRLGDNEPPTVRLGSESHLYEVMVVVRDRQTWVPLSSSAAGVLELLILLTILIGQEHKVLLLDEPALNLHPTKQVQLRKILEGSSTTNQILVVTHSPLLVSMDYSDYTWRFYHDSDGTRAIGLEQIGFSPNVRRKLGGAISEEEWGGLLFASGLVIVEGPGDKFATDEFDLKLGKRGPRLREDNWLVMDTHGKNSIGVLMDFSRRIGIPAVALTDRDGIMECNSKVKNGETKQSMPRIFFSLMESGNLSDTDRVYLNALPREGNYYADSVFGKVRELAKRNNVFALTGSLEDQLGIKKRRKGTLRVVFERVRETQAKQIPPEFLEFFRLIKQRKDQASGKKK